MIMSVTANSVWRRKQEPSLEKGYVPTVASLTLGELMAGGPAEQHQREQEFQMGGM